MTRRATRLPRRGTWPLSSGPGQTPVPGTGRPALVPRTGDTLTSCAGRDRRGATGTPELARPLREGATSRFLVGHGDSGVLGTRAPAPLRRWGGIWKYFNGPERMAVLGIRIPVAVPQVKAISIVYSGRGKTDARGTPSLAFKLRSEVTWLFSSGR